jgi:hypothetical protein
MKRRPKWSKIDDQVVNYADSPITLRWLISILYFVSAWIPLAAVKIRHIPKGLIQ